MTEQYIVDPDQRFAVSIAVEAFLLRVFFLHERLFVSKCANTFLLAPPNPHDPCC